MHFLDWETHEYECTTDTWTCPGVVTGGIGCEPPSCEPMRIGDSGEFSG